MRQLRARGFTRGLSTAGGPRLPQWGSFGKSQAALQTLVTEIDELNEEQVRPAPGADIWHKHPFLEAAPLTARLPSRAVSRVS